MLRTLETYEQGTGQLLYTTQVEVEEKPEPFDAKAEIEALKAEIAELKKDKV